MVNEEIEYREKIMKKAYNKEKITKSERQWLLTHPIYNTYYGYPCLKEDILQLESNMRYRVKLSTISRDFGGVIQPIIGVSYGKGKITVEGDLFDLNGNKVDYKTTKVLCLLWDSDKRESVVDFESELGMLSVYYSCERFSEPNLRIFEPSNSPCVALAMKKEQIADNKVIYRCKSCDSEDFNALVFSVEWSPYNE